MKTRHWFKAAHDTRDAEAMFHCLVEDNIRREEKGLPTFEASYELAYAIIRAKENQSN